MDEWLYALVALVVIGIGLKTLRERHAKLPALRGMADELDDDEPGREIQGWTAVVVGVAEVGLGLWWLVLILGAWDAGV